MEWANYHRLADQSYFLVTEKLLNLEREIEAKGGARLTDALYITRRFEYPWVFTQIPSDTETVLDAGGGPAIFQYLLAKSFKYVHNIDLNQEWIDKVNRTKEATGMFSNLTIEKGDLSDLSKVPDNLFDVTTCISVLEHSDATKITKIVDELLRVTKNLVFLTVDVGQDDPQLMDYKTLYKLEERYRFMIQHVPPDAFQPTTARGKPFRVACIKLVNEK